MGRFLFKIFNKTSGLEEFFKIVEDPILFEWFRFNVQEEEKEETEKISAILNILKPWMNIELYKAENKYKEDAPRIDAERKLFLDEITKHVGNDRLTKILEQKLNA